MWTIQPGINQPRTRPDSVCAKNRYAALFVAAALLPSSGAFPRPPQIQNVSATWTEAALRGSRESKSPAPEASRALAIVNTCMYDAWAAYDDKAIGTQLSGALRRPPAQHTPKTGFQGLYLQTLSEKETAISYAAYRALTDLFPADTESVFKPLMRQLGYDPSNDSTDIETPAGIGNVACAAVLEFRHHDKSNQLGDVPSGRPADFPNGPYSDWTRFTPANPPLAFPIRGTIPALGTVLDPSHWQPLTHVDSRGNYAMQMFSAAHWCFVTPFALPASKSPVSPSTQECPSADEFRSLLAPGPAKYGDPEYLAQAQELLDLSAHLTDRQKMIAEFWSSGSESDAVLVHWFHFAEFVSQRDHHSLDEDIKMYFALSNALLDTSIAVCDAKRTDNSVRPVTAIPFLFHGKQIRGWGGPGKGTVEIDGSHWTPYEPAFDPTPASPEFVSETSAISAASARILALFTTSGRLGDSVTFPKGSSKMEPGVTPRETIVLKWDTFSEAADQAGMSGRYAGIHFRRGDLAGRALGRAVADLAWAKAASYFTGSAKPAFPSHASSASAR
jgi:Domain of unknown function (DUF6851)/VCPO second helical-bundle domain